MLSLKCVRCERSKWVALRISWVILDCTGLAWRKVELPAVVIKSSPRTIDRISFKVSAKSNATRGDLYFESHWKRLHCATIRKRQYLGPANKFYRIEDVDVYSAVMHSAAAEYRDGHSQKILIICIITTASPLDGVRVRVARLVVCLGAFAHQL